MSLLNNFIKDELGMNLSGWEVSGVGMIWGWGVGVKLIICSLIHQKN